MGQIGNLKGKISKMGVDNITKLWEDRAGKKRLNPECLQTEIPMRNKTILARERLIIWSYQILWNERK